MGDGVSLAFRLHNGGGHLKALLAISRVIDAANERLGRVANWAVLIAVAISAGNAMVRYAFDLSSNAWLEVQWYLFAVIGTAVFLVPSVLIIAWFSWPFFMQSWSIQEMSTNAGGLLRWPVKIMLPLGLVLLALQGISEIIKRVAALQGYVRFEFHYERPVQ